MASLLKDTEEKSYFSRFPQHWIVGGAALVAWGIVRVTGPRYSILWQGWWMVGYTLLLLGGVAFLPKSKQQAPPPRPSLLPETSQRRFLPVDAIDGFFGRRGWIGLALLIPALVAWLHTALEARRPWMESLFWLYLYTVFLYGFSLLFALFFRQEKAQAMGMIRKPYQIWMVWLEQDALWIKEPSRTYPIAVEDIRHARLLVDEYQGTHPELTDTLQLLLKDGQTIALPASAEGIEPLLDLLDETRRLEEIPLRL